MEYILQTKDLSKRFGKTVALDRVNLHLKPGDIYGFIGKNGAGKTTAMKIILGFLEPSEGEVIYGDGNNPKEARKRMGSLIESPGLYENGTAKENMKRLAILTGDNDEKIDELLAFVGLQDVGKKPVRSFSLGMKQRLGVAMALLGDPDILILDEPMNALDPRGIKELRDVFARIAKEKQVTIMIASHIIDELAKIATVYGIINNGRLIEEVRVEELEAFSRGGIAIKTVNLEESKAILEKAGYFLEGDEIADEILLKSEGLSVNDIVSLLLKEKQEILAIGPKEKRSFEDFFIERMGA